MIGASVTSSSSSDRNPQLKSSYCLSSPATPPPPSFRRPSALCSSDRRRSLRRILPLPLTEHMLGDRQVPLFILDLNTPHLPSRPRPCQPTSLTRNMRSNRLSIVVAKSICSAASATSIHCPNSGLAAAKTEHRVLRICDQSCRPTPPPEAPHCGDASLGNRDSLLLHGFMDRHTIVGPHLIEFIDTYHSTVSKDLQPPPQSKRLPLLP